MVKGINIRLDEAENQISNLENEVAEKNPNQKSKKKKEFKKMRII